MKNSEKIEIINYIIDLSKNLEEKTGQEIEQPIGVINTGFHTMPLSIKLNDPNYYFFYYQEKIGIPSEILKANPKDITFYKDIYLELNKLIETVYQK